MVIVCTRRGAISSARFIGEEIVMSGNRREKTPCIISLTYNKVCDVWARVVRREELRDGRDGGLAVRSDVVVIHSPKKLMPALVSKCEQMSRYNSGF